MMFILAVLTVLAGFFVVNKIKESLEEKRLLKERNDSFVGAPPFEVDLLDVNEYSRPGTPLEEIKGIVIHYTANPGTTAKNNRDYFQGLKDSHETKVSSHFVVRKLPMLPTPEMRIPCPLNAATWTKQGNLQRQPIFLWCVLQDGFAGVLILQKRTLSGTMM